MKYHYFVSFSIYRENYLEFRLTNNGVTLDNKIESMEDIQKIEEIIQRRLDGVVRVLNFQLLSESEE